MYPWQQRRFNSHQSDIDLTQKCQIDVLSMSIQESLLSGPVYNLLIECHWINPLRTKFLHKSMNMVPAH